MARVERGLHAGIPGAAVCDPKRWRFAAFPGGIRIRSFSERAAGMTLRLLSLSPR